MRTLNVIPFDNEIAGFVSDKDVIASIVKNYRIKSLKEFELSDIAVMPEKVFYVIIKHSSNLHDYIFINNKLPVNPDLLKYLKTYPNFKIIFINDTEPDDEKVLEVLHDYLVHNNFSEKQFIVINNNHLTPEVNVYDLQVYTSNRLDMWIVEYMRHFEPEYIADKMSFFTCHNRVVKPHRYFLLANLRKWGILDDTDWSFLRAKNNISIYKEIGQGEFPTTFYEHLYSKEELDNLREEMYFLDTLESKTSVYEQNFQFDQPEGDYMVTFENNSYKNAYVNLTTESRFDYRGIHISEKSLIPFYFYQIPLILASPGHISAMIKKYDLDFFTDLIDITYDEIKDHKERFQAYLNEVKRIYDMKDEVIDFYKKNKSRLKKNREKILAILNADSDYKYFNGVLAKEDNDLV